MSDGGSQSLARKKLHQRCDELGFTRDERLEWACYALRRDITSFSDLDEAQVLRLLDQVEGFELLSALLAQRPPT